MNAEEPPYAVSVGAAVTAALVVAGTLYVSRSVVLTVAAFVCCALVAAALGRLANGRAAE